MSADRHAVLFVCLGNICRSPLAEGIFIHLARERGVLDRFEVDSAGTSGYHVGERADGRAQEVARRHGVRLPSIARQFQPREDIGRFDLFLPMDRENEANLLRKGAPRERVRLMRSFDPALAGAAPVEVDVPDPYFGADDGFQTVYDMLTRACAGLLDALDAPGSIERPR